MGEYFDLGDYTRPVTTASPAAQRWFSRGLVWAYAFNHEEAVACFERVIEADPGYALGYWGLAYALGPNYNKPWEAFGLAELASSVSRAFTAAQAAAAQAATTGTATTGAATTGAVTTGAVTTGAVTTGPAPAGGARRAGAGARPGRPVPVRDTRRGLRPLEQRVRGRHARGVPVLPR